MATENGECIAGSFSGAPIDSRSPTHESVCVETVLEEEEEISAPTRPPRIRPTRPVEAPLPYHDIDAVKIDMHGTLDEDEWEQAPEDESYDSENSETPSYYRGLLDEYQAKEDEDRGDEAFFGSADEDSLDDVMNGAPGEANPEAPNTRIRDQFQEYCAYMLNDSIELQPEEVAAIRLLDVMWKKHTPLNAYDDLMTWHFRERKWILPHQVASDSSKYISRKTILKRLKTRYNAENKFPFQKKILLPVSGTAALISLHDIDGCIQRLLTHPKIEEGDYLFFNDDPLAGPPPNMECVGDLNTGRAYIDTHDDLITPNSNQQLMGIPMYIDGAAVSQFHHMEIIAVKISLSIFTREARQKEHLWVTIGYIEKVHNHGAKADKIRRESKHMAFQEERNPEHDIRDAQVVPGVGEKPGQDWHAMMTVILEGVVQLQKHGFMWDLMYKGTLHRDIHYKTFIPFIKCDNKEADTICGRYKDYNKCKQICRCCHSKTDECASEKRNQTQR
jgi:hypothetical protein